MQIRMHIGTVAQNFRKKLGNIFYETGALLEFWSYKWKNTFLPCGMNKYYYNGEEEYVGPFTRNQIIRFILEGALDEETLVFREGDSNWIKIEEHEDFRDISDSDNGDIDLKEPSEEEKSSAMEDREQLSRAKREIPKLLKSIRSELEDLWECQREAILARVMDDDLDEELEKKRSKSKDAFKRIEESVIDFWRKDGQLLRWIQDHLRKHADYTFPIAQNDTRRIKMQKIRGWLEVTGLGELRGCYCWKQDEKYLYVGQASVLDNRINTYETHYLFSNATHIRIMIPSFHGCRSQVHYRRKLNALERLLLLQYQPSENKDKNGHKGYNAADQCLKYIMGEVRELATDAE